MANARLQLAIRALQAWQRQRTVSQRTGWCLGATRIAVQGAGLRLPPPQPAPNNTALWNSQMMLRDPGEYGWRRVLPDADRLTLQYFGGVARLRDGRIAGHIGIVDSEAGILYSAVDFPLTAFWQSKRLACFLPAVSPAGPAGDFAPDVEPADASPDISGSGLALLGDADNLDSIDALLAPPEDSDAGQ
ncbi:MAG TPA: hypothetical protein VGM37_03925 [Armatimonadota bacterium]|jgi:hypothetical protein